MKTFDIFLSYRSTDKEAAQRLRNSLEKRGAHVWLDKDQIRPGGRFAEALETGLATSRAVGILVTPESLASNWVKNEYYRALSLNAADELQLIPLVFGGAELPGFMKDRHWIDFQHEEEYDRCVDKLIWPGITGRTVLFVSANSWHGFRWEELGQDLAELGCRVAEGADINRVDEWTRRYFSKSSAYHEPVRIVAVVDIFDEWPRDPFRFRRFDPRQYVDFIFRMREETKGTSDEIVFLLYHNSQAFERAYHALSPEVVTRLAHYFTLHSDTPPKRRKNELKSLWFRIQQGLLKAEH